MGDLWNDHDSYWRSTYSTRPYASGRSYDDLRGGYRYGYESASRHQDRSWDDVESELSRDWDRYEHRGQSTWENVKDAVRDAWNRMTGGSDQRSATSGGASTGSTTRSTF